MRMFTVLILFLSAPAMAAYDPQHALWTRVLTAHVHRGAVDYVALKEDPSDLDHYVESVGELSRDAFDRMARTEQMAYLINAYNAFTVKMITDFYPIDSIRDLGPKVGAVIFGRSTRQWNVTEYEANGHKIVFRAMGQPITLDEIEHRYLRPRYLDARIHFALVCGALSCPPLRSEAYVAARLSAQLDDQGHQFLADPFRNAYEEKRNCLSLSKIFDWYREDFTRAGNLFAFVRQYLPASVAAKIKEAPTIKFIPYDWSLNSRVGK